MGIGIGISTIVNIGMDIGKGIYMGVVILTIA